MYSINFIATTETINKIQNNQIVSTEIHSKYNKITKITYLGLNRSDIDNFNRRSEIKLELFTVKKASLKVNKYSMLSCYHTRMFRFETMVPTSHPHLLNFRYFDEDGCQYFTVIKKSNNQICEAGFIDKDFLGLTSGIVVDIPQSDFDQNQPFD